MHRCAGIHQSMSDFTELEFSNSDEHVEMGISRIRRDYEDIKKMLDWLQNHNPFDDTDPSLRSLSSGHDSTGKDGINCDTVEDVGIMMQRKMDNKFYTDMSFKRADKIRTLENLRKGTKIGCATIHIDPMILFSRLLIQVERSNDIQSLFAYELTPIPTALFRDDMMRKGNKSSLGASLKEGVKPAEISEISNAKFVIDGGALLHRIYWRAGSSFKEIVGQYVTYVNSTYGGDRCTIVFDGYASSTKDHEHSRREVGRTASYTMIAENIIAPDNQQAFLKNDLNKTQLIDMLMKGMKDNGHNVHQSDSDADTIIVEKALTLLTAGHNTVVVSDDTDILVLLIHNCDGLNLRRDTQLYFLSPATRKSKLGIKVFRIFDIMESVGLEIVKNILFIHAWSGCDTTSATYGQGKVALLKHIRNKPEVRLMSQQFYSIDASPVDIATIGEKLFILLYAGEVGKLNELRYRRYMSAVASSNVVVRPEKLPPTESAARYHALRVHLQVLQWAHPSMTIEPEDWGWKKENQKYCPIMTDIEPAPSDLLNVVRCKCKKRCNNACSCKKNGLRCVSACKHCNGMCDNTEPPSISPEEFENNARTPIYRNIFDLFDC